LKKKKLLFIVNVDWFFKSHRLPIALEAIRRGYEVSLATENSGLFEEFSTYGIKCYSVAFKRGHSSLLDELFSIFRVFQLCKKIRPDIIHNVTLKPYLYVALVRPLINRKIRIVNAITGLGYLFTGPTKPFLGSFVQFFLKFTLGNGRSNYFIFQNEDDYKFFKGFLSLRTGSFFFIKGSGVDHLKFRRQIPHAPSGSKKIQITLVSRMLKDKGVFEFIAAAKKLKESLFGHCVFTLIGGVDLMNPSAITESELINELEDEYIIWLGHRNDIMDVYNSTDIACLPSYREGLPKSLVEAMAMSCPIVSTDVPGCRECVEDGVNGFLVPSRNSDLLADRILLLVGNSELRIKMGHASRAKMEKEMSLQTVIDQTFTVYGS